MGSNKKNISPNKNILTAIWDKEIEKGHKIC